MNAYQLYTLSCSALKCEGELSLAHLQGRHLDKLPHLKGAHTRFKGVLLRVLIFFYSLIKRVRIGSGINDSSADVIIYAGSQNQANSLISTVTGLIELKIKHYVILGDNKLNGFEDYSLLTIPPKVALVAILIFFRHCFTLYLKLRRNDKNDEIKFAFHIFCSAYVYIPLFIYTLSNQKSAKMVILSNDHNVDTRSLRLAAEILSVKTLYMQHASVSELFPPLRFDYALLDGEMALKTYISCETLSMNSLPYNTNVFLSGQKKLLAFDKADYGPNIGIAVNSLDEIELVLELVDIFVKNEYSVTVRTHPGQSKFFITELKRYIQNNNLVTWSDSQKDDLATFFFSVNSVIAANSSIHLEASLVGLPTMYYEFTKAVDRPDYYGYVEKGVSSQLNPKNVIDSFKDGIKFARTSDRKSAIKLYSESYSTIWEHKEGRLSAVLIQRLLEKKSVLDLFYDKKSNSLYLAHKLRN